MRRIFLLFLMAFIGFGCGFSPDSTATINDTTFSIEVATTPDERMLGLMHRPYMSPDHGMLFVFEKEEPHSFWMKNTLIPLDMVWIDKDMNVVDIQQAQPCESTPCPNYRPSANALYVLEVNEGAFPGKVGDTIDLNLIPS